jgi:hypothetical protein
MSGMPKTWRDYQAGLGRRQSKQASAWIVLLVVAVGAAVWAYRLLKG